VAKLKSVMALIAGATMLLTNAASAADHSVGIWKRNVGQTKYESANPNPITSLIMERDAVPGGLRIISKGHRKDGTPINYSVTVLYDGKDYPVSGIGSVFNTISVTEIDADHFPSVTKKGDYHMNGMTVISKDGKTMTISNKGTGADGKPTTFSVVWDKIADSNAKAAAPSAPGAK
jgi:hypothetical protein